MRVQSFLLGAVALLSSTAVAAEGQLDSLAAEYEQIVARTPCHPKGVHVIGSSGAGRNNLHSYGLLASLMGSLMSAIPHSTNFSLPYHKGQATVDSPDPALAIQQGTHNLRHYINFFHKKCPHTPIVLAGYSAGAVMSTNNICGGMGVAPVPKGHNIIAHVGYGDETFSSGQSWDRGTCTAGAGLHPRDPSTCEYFAKKMRSYCDAPDPDCCGGTDVNAHFGYPVYDADATKFVQHRFRIWKHEHKHHHHHHGKHHHKKHHHGKHHHGKHHHKKHHGHHG